MNVSLTGAMTALIACTHVMIQKFSRNPDRHIQGRNLNKHLAKYGRKESREKWQFPAYHPPKILVVVRNLLEIIILFKCNVLSFHGCKCK